MRLGDGFPDSKRGRPGCHVDASLRVNIGEKSKAPAILRVDSSWLVAQFLVLMWSRQCQLAGTTTTSTQSTLIV